MKPPDVVDAEFSEEAELKRPRLVGSIVVPVESIDGTSSIGAGLKVRGNGDGFVTLEISGKNVRVRSEQLDAALQSLAMLTPSVSYRPIGHTCGLDEIPMPPMPPQGPFRPRRR